MPISLTDQLFQSETKSLSDQLFDDEVTASLTDQLFGPVTEIPEVGKFGRQTFKIPSEEPIVEDPTLLPVPASITPKEIKTEFTDEGVSTLSQDIDRLGTTISEGLKMFSTMAANPMETIKGGLDFALSIPGFMVGIGNAVVHMTAENIQQLKEGPLKPRNISKLYDAAVRGMEQSVRFFEPGKQLLLGEPTPESQLVGQIAMAPMTELSRLGHNVASWPRFEGYPNIQGLAKFTGDIAGLIAMGAMLKQFRFKEFTAESEKIIRQADNIVKKEQSIDGIPNEALKQAQQAIVNVEKRQLELRAEELSKKVSEDLLIREELGRQAEEIARAKTLGPETAIEQAKPGPIAKAGPRDLDVVASAIENAKASLIETAKPSAIETAKVRDLDSAQKSAIETAKPSLIEQAESDSTVIVARDANDRIVGIRIVSKTGETIGGPEEPSTQKQLAIRSQEIKTKSPTLSESEALEIASVEGELGVKFDGIQEFPPALDRPSIFQFTDEKGITFNVEGISREVVESKLNEMRGLREVDVSDMSLTEQRALETLLDVKEVDEQTGTKTPKLEGTKSPFFQDKETTDVYSKLYDERAKAVAEDVELFTQKLINDTNKWLHGDETVNIARVRNGLSGLAARGEELRSEFIKGVDHQQWLDTVKEAAEWARKTEREFVADNIISGAIKDIKDKGLENQFDARNLFMLEVRKKANLTDELTQDLFLRPEFTEDAMLKIDKAFREGATTDDIIKLADKFADVVVDRIYPDRLKIEPTEGEGPKFITGIPIEEAAKTIVAGARKVAEYTKHARGMKQFKPLDAARALRQEFNRSFVDRSGNIRGELLDKLGAEGYEVVQKMYLSKGASSVSANMLKQMQKEVYSGLSGKEKQVLDNLILADRMVDIGQYKTEKQFKFPEEIKPTNSVAYKELFQQIEKLTPERATEIRRRADAYFEWMKRPLEDMLESGLISQEEFVALVAHNFRKIKLVDVYDKRYATKVGKTKRTVYDSGVESLARGRDTDVFEPSSEIMALEVFNRSYGRILNNEANKTLAGVARHDPTNPFVRIKEKKGDKIPTGWSRIFVFEGGERKSLYLSPEMSKEWITNSPELSYKMSQMMRYVSGSPVLRTFATGINWGFALANLPRDVMHTWFAARTFADGEWSSVYSPHAPAFAMQITRDLANVFIDAATKGPKYQGYISRGGGMEFLVHQGRLFQRGRHLEGSIDKIYDFLGYFGETSEIMTRLAIEERVARTRGKEKGITLKEARKDKAIMDEATFAARDYMDFGQGGGIAKALDNAFPYANATVQGSRGLWRAFKPGSGTAFSSTYKLAQFAALTTGLYVAMRKMHPKSTEALEGNIDMQNNLIIPLGDEFGFVDDRGQTRYPYFKIPLDPGQKFFKTFFEAATDKWLGNPIDINRVVDSLKEQSPVGVTELPPSISGVLGYITNKDFWLNEDIWKQTDKPFSFPKSKEEFIPGVTPEIYKDIGAATGLSPERTRYAVEELTTSGTLWSYLLGQGYEAMFGDLPENKKQQHLAMTLAKTPVMKRFFGITNPYSKHASVINKAQEEAVLEQFVQNRELDRLTEGYMYENSVTRKEVFKYVNSFKDVDTRDRLTERFKFQEFTKNLPERSFWMRLQGLRLEARAEVFVDRLNRADEEERRQLWKEYAIVSRAGGIVSDAFRKEVMRLRSQVQE